MISRIAKRIAGTASSEDQLIEGINQARSHLNGAIVQILPTDDQIIADHIRDAAEILNRLVK